MPQLGSNFVLEPQGQIVWQHTAFDQRNDGEGEVGLGSSDMTSGRIGVRGKWTLETDDHHVWQPYARVNLWDDWRARSRTNFGGTNVALLAGGERLEAGGGVTTKIRDNLSFYLNADYEFAIGHNDGGKRDGVRGAAGVRYSW
ncbi:autotransporter outer membrane beta-barrel domain-containing protein [Dyella sp. 2HG41-7]|uniref:autotransporter outer membrane beta-barrel domain-containing protein n=1 Tax=Dyella sp. 2HG41-7 TaxID=2883239 RepID=UPI0021069EC2|nr:autotransporter outer membrane beta-barrel domain-containing protein [Dyella sp. 2HG41-7]